MYFPHRKLLAFAIQLVTSVAPPSALLGKVLFHARMFFKKVLQLLPCNGKVMGFPIIDSLSRFTQSRVEFLIHKSLKYLQMEVQTNKVWTSRRVFEKVEHAFLLAHREKIGRRTGQARSLVPSGLLKATLR